MRILGLWECGTWECGRRLRAPTGFSPNVPPTGRRAEAPPTFTASKCGALSGILVLFAVIVALSQAARADTANLAQDQILDAALIGVKHPRESWVPNDVSQWYLPYRLRDNGSVFLIKFDLSSIPAGARILAAQLGIYVEDRNHHVNTQHLDTKVGVWRMLVEWGPGVCWENRGGKDEKAWGQPGGKQAGQDRAQQPTDTPLLKSTRSWLKFNVRADVEAILGGEPNYGWAIENMDVTNGEGFELITPISGDPKFRPTLTITYQPK